MAEFNQVYARAAYYDIVFRRDVSHEVDFLLAEYKRLNGRDAASMLEIACGPGYHARQFARRGLATHRLDL
ncbi:MAG: hypothetical protein KDE14_13210, partial [Rhodobacteraceae bacterium]|nr:hypothetical protein [Paracoccaceae bacterium]